MAGGERAPIMRSTWNGLRALGCVVWEEGTRITITERGLEVASRRPFKNSWREPDEDAA